jgi:hypothetical protein
MVHDHRSSPCRRSDEHGLQATIATWHAHLENELTRPYLDTLLSTYGRGTHDAVHVDSVASRQR